MPYAPEIDISWKVSIITKSINSVKERQMIESDRPDSKQQIIINGINGATGGYLVAPMDKQYAAQLIIRQDQDRKSLDLLRALHQRSSRPHLGPPGMKMEDVKQAGWGVIFHTQEEQAVRDAMMPLIEHRRRRIGNDVIVKVLDYRDDETYREWLRRHRVGIGVIEPEKVPFYLLLVGSPDRIPFDFGYLLDIEYSVGRLHFDSTEGYEAYARSVIAYETAASVPTSKKAVFFGTRHDQPTHHSSEFLIKPLADMDHGIVARVANESKVAYQSELYPPDSSRKEALYRILHPNGSALTPCLLFTATHGVGWPPGHPDQAETQGALLCQDFRSPGWGRPNSEHYFAASDLAIDARVHGLVCFHFACYSAGTPQRDRFIQQPGKEPSVIAPKPFFSSLPKALLSHQNGGALGVIGHIERAWETSIGTSSDGLLLQLFENAIWSILMSHPLGYALDKFNKRYATLSTNLAAVLEQIRGGDKVSDENLLSLWLERNDAESYILFGDPAVSLRVDALH
jgi:peptidase C25-like protein